MSTLLLQRGSALARSSLVRCHSTSMPVHDTDIDKAVSRATYKMVSRLSLSIRIRMSSTVPT